MATTRTMYMVRGMNKSGKFDVFAETTSTLASIRKSILKKKKYKSIKIIKSKYKID